MNYKVIGVYTSEDARWRGQPVHEAILTFVHGQKLAARCAVTRGIAGCYENGEVATMKLEILSFKMPLRIEIILPASESERVLPTIQDMVEDGIVSVSDLNVVSHKTQKHLIPRHLRVRDVMSLSPKKAVATTPVADVVRMLLSADFNSVPVVDDLDRPVGIITQGDLISRGQMPVRLGLMEQLDRENLDAVLKAMSGKTAGEIMTQPVVTIGQDSQLSEAVDVMLDRNFKRLPVVDAGGKLVGVLARLDVFRTITTETPDWKALGAQNVVVNGLCPVKDIMRRDTHTVLADATLEEVMRVIDSNDIQRVAVIDPAGKLLGLVSDHDLLRLFSGHKVGVWDRMASKLTFTEMGKRHKTVVDQARKRIAGEIMKTDLVTIGEDAPIDEAIRVMTQKQIKRLPVVDAEGKFKGMVSRDSLLRAGMGGSAIKPGA
jgi:CBS domain-containing protein